MHQIAQPLLRALAPLLLSATLTGQTTPDASAIPSASPSASPVVTVVAPDQGTAPPILVPAVENTFLHSLTFTSAAPPVAAEIKAGALAGTDTATQQLIPTIKAEEPVKSGQGWSVPIRVSGLIPFGASTLPIFYQGRKIETLHLLKNGLTVDVPASPQQAGDPLLLVLHNPSGSAYTTVRARLRFRDQDICTFSVERFTTPGIPPTAAQGVMRQKDQVATSNSAVCEDVASWTEFQIPQYSGASLRAVKLPGVWFDAPDGYARAMGQKGTLTLRFSSEENAAGQQPLLEQVLPVQINFQPSTASRSIGYARVAAWLLTGALFSLLLRIAIPNYRRFRSLKDQLEEIRKTTRGISDEVDSMLRVQLRVENMSLDTLRRSVLVISPDFSEVAQRVDTAIATLRRRIDYVRRLDAALNRRRLLITDELAQPTRIAAIDRHLNTASEELKSDQFREQDWVFIQTALEAADKILGNPSEEDKSTFETILVQRWKSIATQYGFDPDEGWLNIPDSLEKMMTCFPRVEALCPRVNPAPGQPEPLLGKDYDVNQWIKTAGTVRADLQITALELIREFQFLAPGQIENEWQDAMHTLIPWLGTPAFENLNNARSLLRQLSEGISPLDIVAALRGGRAHIELDPQVIASGERVRLAVRFWQQEWNTAAARQQIVCEWRFKAYEGKKQSGTPEIKAEVSDTGPSHSLQAKAVEADADAETLFYSEKGWEIYHYFDKARGRAPLHVVFYFGGKPVTVSDDSPDLVLYPFVIDLQSERKYKTFMDQAKRIAFESLELGAALLVPLCALAISTADKGSSSQWWQLLGLGFGSDTIRNVLSATAGSKPLKPS